MLRKSLFVEDLLLFNLIALFCWPFSVGYVLFALACASLIQARYRNDLIAAERTLVRILSLLTHSQLAGTSFSSIDLTPSMNAPASFLKLHLPLSDHLGLEGEGENARLSAFSVAITRLR